MSTSPRPPAPEQPDDLGPEQRAVVAMLEARHRDTAVGPPPLAVLRAAAARRPRRRRRGYVVLGVAAGLAAAVVAVAVLPVRSTVPLVGLLPPSGEPTAVTQGDPAVWEPSDRWSVDVTSESVEIGVSRVGCASGTTGEVLAPVVSYEPGRVVIEVDVAADRSDGAQSCPRNDVVPVVVDLAEPVGDRDLVDGACLDGEAASTTLCDEPVRLAGARRPTSELEALAAFLRSAGTPDYAPFASLAAMRAEVDVAVEGTVRSVTAGTTDSPVYNRQNVFVTLDVTDDLRGSGRSTVVLALDVPVASTSSIVTDALVPGTRIVVFGSPQLDDADGEAFTDAEGNEVVGPVWQGLYFVEPDGRLVDHAGGDGFADGANAAGADAVASLKASARRG